MFTCAGACRAGSASPSVPRRIAAIATSSWTSSFCVGRPASPRSGVPLRGPPRKAHPGGPSLDFGKRSRNRCHRSHGLDEPRCAPPAPGTRPLSSRLQPLPSPLKELQVLRRADPRRPVIPTRRGSRIPAGNPSISRASVDRSGDPEAVDDPQEIGRLRAAVRGAASGGGPCQWPLRSTRPGHAGEVHSLPSGGAPA